jgi:ABC-type uncharacterized transport system fused permease/ATPase subunit
MPRSVENVAVFGAFEKTASVVFVVLTAVTLLVQRRLLLYYRWRLRHLAHDPDAMENINASSFLAQLKAVASIAITSWRSKEVAATTSFVLLFGIKAWLNVVRVNADGSVVQAVVTQGSHNKFAAVGWLASISLALAAVTGVIEQLRFWLIAHYRARLTSYFHERLFKSITFYRVGLLDDRINAGTAIATYCHEFAEHFAELPYYFVLPSAEAFASLFFLSRQAGAGPAAMIVAGTVASLFFLRATSPEFGRMHAVTLDAEERFRLSHADVRNHAEQLALHNGGEYMRKKLNNMFRRCYDALAQVAVAKGFFSLLQNAVSLGLWDVMPLLLAWHKGRNGGRRDLLLQALLVQRPLIRNFHQSVEALIENIKEASHLYEFTDKLCEFDSALKESIENLPTAAAGLLPVTGEALPVEDDGERPDVDPELMRIASASEFSRRASQINLDIMEDDEGNALRDQYVQVEDVAIETPGTNNRLVSRLSFTVERGSNWVILGPNGSGKTSILRVLAGLWHPVTGTISRSPGLEVFFMPQQAFLLSNATLFEQLAFPEALEHNGQRAVATPRDLEFAKVAMGSAFAENIAQMLGGWESPVCGFGAEEDLTYPWESLSGGQQQKLAIARLFFRAQVVREHGVACFAMLDESTSQIDADSEDIIFTKLKAFGVTFVSVTHRERVIAHHSHALILQPHRRSYKIRRVRADMPSHSESGTQLVDW